MQAGDPAPLLRRRLYRPLQQLRSLPFHRSGRNFRRNKDRTNCLVCGCTAEGEIRDWLCNRFLKGSNSSKLWEEHRYLPTFGKGAEHTRDEWRSYLNDLIRQGFLKQSEGEFTLLRLTPEAHKVLYENHPVQLVRVHSRKSNRELRQRNATRPNNPELPHPELNQLLRQLRRQIADSEGVAAYMVFSDASLAELVTYLPQTTEALHSISGFGQAKVDHYGSTIVEVIRAYCGSNGIEHAPERKARKNQSPPVPGSTKTISIPASAP